MLNERREIVRGINGKLAPAEHHIDLTLAAIADLNSHLPIARAAAGVALEVGHEAMAAFGEAQTLMLLARAKMIEGHRCLAVVQTDYRFPVVADGGLGNKSPNPPVLLQPVPAAA